MIEHDPHKQIDEAIQLQLNTIVRQYVYEGRYGLIKDATKIANAKREEMHKALEERGICSIIMPS